MDSQQEKKAEHENLQRIIQERLNLGHDITTIKQNLISRGYSEEDIHNIIDNLNAENKEPKSQKKRSLLSSLKPNMINLLLPIIFIIILIPYIMVIYSEIPAAGEDLCGIVTLNSQVKGIIASNMSEEVKKLEITQLQKKEIELEIGLAEKLNMTTRFSSPFYFTKAYYINPFFPLPCETQMFHKSRNCGFYIKKSDFDCIAGSKISMVSEFMGSQKIFKGISLGYTLLHSAIIMGVLYIISSLLINFRAKTRIKEDRKKIIELAIGIIILAIIAIFIISYFYFMKIFTGG